ncbi:MAG: choice-of-anchor Q domain-containing protein, partial [Candidatus Binatia bacterium]
SGNTGLGGGIGPIGNLLRLESSTITKNHGIPYGGGFYSSNNRPITMRNTIVAGNTSQNGSIADCGGPFTSQGYNLIGTIDNICQITGDATGNVIGVDARLGALADNGGATRTHAPLSADDTHDASPAIDAGSPATPGSEGSACPAIDQRGVLRPLGAACDIGAFERGSDLAVTRLIPSRAGNAGPLSVVAGGSGFADGATVILRRAGDADVVASAVNTETGGSSLAASLDVTGLALGAWDLVVTNPDDSTVTLAGALTIEATRAPQLWADIIGRSAIRAGSPARFSIVYGNRGNVDAVGVPLALAYPKDFLFDVLFAIAAPPVLPAQAIDDFSVVPIVAEVDPASDLRNIPLFLPVVPAGFTGIIEFVLTAPAGTAEGAKFLVSAKIDPEPWLASDAEREARVAELVAGGRAYAERALETPIPASVDAAATIYARAQLEAIVAAGRADLVARLGQTGSVYSLGQLVIDVAAFMRDQALASADLGWGWKATLARLVGLVWPATVETAEATTPCACRCGALVPEGCSCSTKDCDKPYQPPDKPPSPGGFKAGDCTDIPNHKVSADGKQCIPTNLDGCSRLIPNTIFADPDCITIPILQSADPNDKTTSSGFGPTHVVTGDEPLKYAIDFENLPTATAPAQVVQVTDQLDTASLDLATFAFGAIAIGADVTILPPPGVADFSGAADLRPGRNILASVVAHLDSQTGIATWTFTSLDPATGQLTEDPEAGFLPPDVTPPDGQGRVLYTVAAKPSVATGTVIKNKASIVFDVNAPIETPEVSSTIDKTPPVSAVTAVTGANGCGAALTVEWSGTDEGSVVADYSVFVSTNGGPFTLWREHTTETSAVFQGEAQKTYGFATTARDIVEHEETLPATADVTHTTGICGTEQDLAVTKLKVSARIKLTAKKPVAGLKVSVEIQNRSRHAETIPDLATLAALATVSVDSLGACADPVATFRAPKKPKAIVLKPAKKLKLVFDVAVGCANDPLKGIGHGDYTFSAHVDHGSLGAADDHPADDVCPRDVAPPGAVDTVPLKPIVDKGCGTKKADKTFGGLVALDVVGP